MMRKLGFLALSTALTLAACNSASPETLPDDNMSEIGNLSENTDIAVTPPPVANVTVPSNATDRTAARVRRMSSAGSEGGRSRTTRRSAAVPALWRRADSVSSATMRPWSMTITRSHSRSTSSM